MDRRIIILVTALLGLVLPLSAQYDFDFTNTSDTIVVNDTLMEFHFQLENTGTLADTYMVECRVIDTVPGWFDTYCADALCSFPGAPPIPDYLGAGAVDTAIHIDVYPSQDSGMAVYNLHVRSVFNPSLKDSITVFAVYGVAGQYSLDFSCLDDTIIMDTTMVEFQFRLENTGTSPDTYAFDLQVVDSVAGWIESFFVDGEWANPGTILSEYLGIWGADTAIYVRVDPSTGPGTEKLNLHVQSMTNPDLSDSINIYVISNAAIKEYPIALGKKSVLQVYPNPFTGLTDITFYVSGLRYEGEALSLRIYNSYGGMVKQFENLSNENAEVFHLIWHGDDESGSTLPSGTYFIRLASPDFILTDKIILIR